MKIIHTSDWHLGQTFYEYDRTTEHQDMLRQIVEIVRDEQPDALVVSGDIFHTGNPVPKAVELYNRALLKMHMANPTMAIVVTGGNHDSATRLVVNNDLWDCFGVTIVGSIARNNNTERTPNYDKHIVEVKDSNGNRIGYIAAVPHCYESNYPVTDPKLQRQERAQAYYQGLLDQVHKRNIDNLPVVLMAHLAVNGCDYAGHDNIGGMDAHDVSILGTGYDYVALGHIHTPHNISERVRYSGTPIPVNFGEKYEHSVSVVTIESGELPIIRTRRIVNKIPLHDFPSEPAGFSTVLEKIKDYDNNELCYIRLLVKVDNSMTPLANTLVGDAVKNKKCRVCSIQYVMDETQGKETDKARSHRLTSNELRYKTPLDIAEMFFDMKGIEMTDNQREMIRHATVKAELLRKGIEDEA